MGGVGGGTRATGQIRVGLCMPAHGPLPAPRRTAGGAHTPSPLLHQEHAKGASVPHAMPWARAIRVDLRSPHTGLCPSRAEPRCRGRHARLNAAVELQHTFGSACGGGGAAQARRARFTLVCDPSPPQASLCPRRAAPLPTQRLLPTLVAAPGGFACPDATLGTLWKSQLREEGKKWPTAPGLGLPRPCNCAPTWSLVRLLLQAPG